MKMNHENRVFAQKLCVFAFFSTEEANKGRKVRNLETELLYPVLTPRRLTHHINL